MTKAFAALTVLFLVATIGLYLHLHEVVKGPYSKTPYADLQPKLVLLQNSLSGLEAQKPAPADFVRVETTRGFLRKDIEQLKRELHLRQANVLLGFATILFAAAFILRLLVSFFRGNRAPSQRKGKSGGAHHSGKIVTAPSRVEYIHQDDLKRKVTVGFVDAAGAEDWLRSDDFLHCPHCQTAVDAETIGTIQEVIYYEETPRNVPKEQIQKLGAVWIAKPKDRFTCKKCGRELIRSAR